MISGWHAVSPGIKQNDWWISSLILAKCQLLLWWFKNKQTTSLCPQMWVVCAVKLYLWVCIYFLMLLDWYDLCFHFDFPYFVFYSQMPRLTAFQFKRSTYDCDMGKYSNLKWIRCEPFWSCALYVFGHITHTMNNVCIFSHDKGTREITAMHCIALHCIALHYIALHCIALHCIAFHCISLHCIALHCNAWD